jgi:hypothetical protein
MPRSQPPDAFRPTCSGRGAGSGKRCRRLASPAFNWSGIQLAGSSIGTGPCSSAILSPPRLSDIVAVLPPAFIDTGIEAGALQSGRPVNGEQGGEVKDHGPHAPSYARTVVLRLAISQLPSARQATYLYAFPLSGGGHSLLPG